MSGLVKAGSTFRPSASEWNRLVDFMRSTASDASVMKKQGASSHGVVVFVSGTAGAYDPGTAVGLGEPINTPDDAAWKGKQVYTATAPVAGGAWGIMLAPLLEGAMAPVCVCGAVVAIVAEAAADVTEGMTDLPKFADITEGVLTLSYSGPARVLYRDTTTGWSLIVLSGDLLIDDLSLEANTKGKAQITAWDNEDNGTASGVSQVIKADPESGEILVIGDYEEYELLVRVGGVNGTVGYMPFGQGTGEKPPPDPCEDHPEGGDGVGSGEGGAGAGGAGADDGDGGVPAGASGGDGAAAGCTTQCNY